MALPGSVLNIVHCDVQTEERVSDSRAVTMRAYTCEAGARPIAHDVSIHVVARMDHWQCLLDMRSPPDGCYTTQCAHMRGRHGLP